MKKIIQKVNSDKNFTKEAYIYMKNEFDKERAKPFNKRDWCKLERLSSEMNELFYDNTGRETDNGKARLMERITEIENVKQKSSARKIRRFVPAIVIAAVLTAVNCISVLALDMNIFKSVVKFIRGGVVVSFEDEQEQSVVELPTSENDPYGISAECAKYDVYPTEFPTYIPEGFELTYTTHNVNPDYANFVSFTFENGKKTISIDYTRYWNEVGNDIIPSDDHNISKMDINGSEAIVSKEDKEYIITYIKGKTVFYMYAKNVDYDECDKIVESIK